MYLQIQDENINEFTIANLPRLFYVLCKMAWHTVEELGMGH
jgi:hypothetical protein